MRSKFLPLVTAGLVTLLLASCISGGRKIDSSRSSLIDLRTAINNGGLKVGKVIDSLEAAIALYPPLPEPEPETVEAPAAELELVADPEPEAPEMGLEELARARINGETVPAEAEPVEEELAVAVDPEMPAEEPTPEVLVASEEVVDDTEALLAFENSVTSFQDGFSRLRSDAENVRSRVAELDRNAQRVFRRWENEIAAMNSASISSRSEERQNEVIRRFSAVHASLENSRAEYQALTALLDESETLLRNRLRRRAEPDDRDALNSLAARAKLQGGILENSLLGSINAINSALDLWDTR